MPSFVRFVPFMLFASLILSASIGAESRPNVLFIAVDDLKPILGAYGDELVITPAIDRLAAEGVVFLNAHCQQAVCGPSRASLLTGLRPDSTGIWDLQTRIRDVNPDVITIPQYFRNNGYNSVGVGKIFDYRSVDGHGRDDPASWSRPYVQVLHSADEEYGMVNPQYVASVKEVRASLPEEDRTDWGAARAVMGGSPAWEGTEDVSDSAYEDGRIADTAIELLSELSASEDPFFLAVGFKKPHLPFAAPKRYWDLYDRSQFDVADRTTPPTGAPGYHFQPGWELRNGSYQGFADLEPNEPLPDDVAITLIHGYHACVSYIDTQIGRVLDALDSVGERDNTIVVLWGDHGWHLGDHGMWCKHTNYEQATRAPLIISDPNLDGLTTGGRSSSPVEFVDIFPTLNDLAGLPPGEKLEGVSLVPVLMDPASEVKAVAVSQYPRHRDGDEIMGYAYRSDRYRYIEWENNQFRKGGIRGEIVDIELYDYETDPLETRNLAGDAAYAEVLHQMQVLALQQKDRYRQIDHVKTVGH